MYVYAMLISGALVGLAGVNQVLGTVTTGFSAGIDAGIGFDAITVALLGRSTPWGIFVAGILFGAFKAGGFSMQAAEGVPIEIVLVVQSLIVLFIAAPPLVRAIFRLPDPEPRPRRHAPASSRRRWRRSEHRHREHHAARRRSRDALDTTVVTQLEGADRLRASSPLVALAARSCFAPRTGTRRSGCPTPTDADPAPRRSSCRPWPRARGSSVVLLAVVDRVLACCAGPLRSARVPLWLIVVFAVAVPVRLPHLGRRRARTLPVLGLLFGSLEPRRAAHLRRARRRHRRARRRGQHRDRGPAARRRLHRRRRRVGHRPAAGSASSPRWSPACSSSLVLAAFSIKYFVDQVIVGVVLNVLVIGLTSFFFSQVLRAERRRC